MAKLRSKVNAAFIDFIKSREFSPQRIPSLSDEFWVSAGSAVVELGRRSSTFDAYATEGRFVLNHAVFRSIVDVEDLRDKPPGYIRVSGFVFSTVHNISMRPGQFMEEAICVNDVIRELFEKLEPRALDNKVSSIRDGFFAFVGAHWEQVDRKTDLTIKWLVDLLRPVLMAGGRKYASQYVNHGFPFSMKLK